MHNISCSMVIIPLWGVHVNCFAVCTGPGVFASKTPSSCLRPVLFSVY